MNDIECCTMRTIAEELVEQWDCHHRDSSQEQNEPREIRIAKEFLRLLSAVEQASKSNFSSVAANGVLSAAVKYYSEH